MGSGGTPNQRIKVTLYQQGEEQEPEVDDNIIDADGNPQEQGISYMKADLHDMGIDDDDINDAVPDTEDMEEFIDALNKFLKKVGKMRPWVSIRVVPPKKTGYGNTIYIQGLMEDQDQKPDVEEDNIPM